MKNVKAIFIAVNVSIYLLIGFLVYSEISPKNLEVHFFDIGQGDGMLIRTPQRKSIVIDGGPDNLFIHKIGEYLPFYERTIDLLILSHPDADHVVGLVELARRYDIKNALLTGVIDDHPAYHELLSELKRNGAFIFIAGDIKRLMIEPDVYFDVLYPFESLEDKEQKHSNDASIIGRLVYKDQSFLFTGDASVEVEEDLVLSSTDISSSVLKVGHHGSKTSTGEEFIKAVQPQVAIIQAGEGNRFDHPHQVVLDRLDNFQITIFSTIEYADISIYSDGKSIFLRP